MDKKRIGENAGIVWNLLNDHQKWNVEKIKQASGLTESEIYSAIGWLARENKIEMEKCPKGNDDCYYLIIEYYF